MAEDRSSRSIRALAERIKRLSMLRERNGKARAQEREKLVGNIRKTALVVVIFVLWVAALADLLSFIDFGWLVSWAIPLACALIVRRMNAIGHAAEGLATATAAHQRQEAVLRQRLRPLLAASGNSRMLVAEAVSDISYQFTSYVRAFVRDTIITQLLELIPILDMLPMYLGQVVKVIIDQNIAYQKAMKLVPAYDRAVVMLERLERFELEYLLRRLNALVGVLRAGDARQRSLRAPVNAATESAPLNLRPQLAT
jgi:hypothetical protein